MKSLFAQASIAAIVLLALCAPPGAQASTGQTAERSTTHAPAKAQRSGARPQPRAADRSRRDAPVVAVEGPGPGQAGYVHYFIITGPDGEPINHVAVEMADGRVASSFPDDGVSAAPFVKDGTLTTTAGNRYRVEHLYGVRPFTDDAAMRAYQQSLESRVQDWLDSKTRYCDELDPSGEFCVSCLSFVMSVLYPEGLPRDFRGARRDMYSTEDLLMYLTGVPVDAPPAAREQRIAALAAPAHLRADLSRISAALAQTAAAEPASVSPRERSGRISLRKRAGARRRS